MEVWSGSISTSSNCNLQGVRLIDPSSTSQCSLAKNAKLSVNAFVNPTLVPLYCQTGPTLEVHITEAETAAWLKDRLLANVRLDLEDCDEAQMVQCPVAVLLRVESHSRRDSQKATNTWDRVTDILVYGILTPSSSTTEAGDGNLNGELRIYAVSLCAGRETKAQGLPSPPQSPSPDDAAGQGEIAEFLPDMRSPSAQKKKVATLFEAATEFHNKARRRGGIGISDFGRKEDSQVPTDSPYMRLKRDRDNAASQDIDHGASQATSTARNCGRSKSSTLQNMVQSSSFERSRSKSFSSRRGTPAPFPKDGTSSHLSNPSNTSTRYSKTAPPEETMATNKALLTRTILTSMRLYGYHRNSRGTARPATPAPGNADISGAADGEKQSQSTCDAEEDDEFKAMYHATYRASTFALRQFLKPSETNTAQSAPKPLISVPILERDRAMHVVDSVLKLFCEGQG